MKPKDLKFPFSWEERKPLFKGGVFFVPKFYEEHRPAHFPSWEDERVFGKSGKVFIEYCAGNGAWIVSKAREFPEVHWVAVEKKFERVRKIWSKIQNYKLNNLIVVCGEALTFTKNYVLNDSVEGVFINFPDPWPKERHAKHRLIQRPFVDEIARIVREDGTATFVTDDASYSEQMIQAMAESAAWKSFFAQPFYTTEWPDYGSSYFDALWRQKGKAIRYMHFTNCKTLG